MRKIALYGKGGIGKSTIASNLTVSLSRMGYSVMQIGCDPKADSTKLLLGNISPPTILDVMKQGKPAEEAVVRGTNGCYCAECGGPRPGSGCAGRGIIAAFEQLEKQNVIKKLSPDILLFDVLGDVVCGGFAMPIRNGYARDVFIVSSGEMMSLYAANNIATAISDMGRDGYASLGGIIQNSRGIDGEDEAVDRAALEIGTGVIGRIPRDKAVQRCEAMGMTVAEGAPDSGLSRLYARLAEAVVRLSHDTEGGTGDASALCGARPQYGSGACRTHHGPSQAYKYNGGKEPQQGNGMSVLILDMVHGGDILAAEYLKKGYSVVCVDVYRTAKKELMSELAEAGISVHTEVPAGRYDLLLMPVHCPDVFLKGVEYGERKTFHEAVGELSEGRRIEVTGVKGKTSCCYLLAHILSLDGRSVFLHTSRGQGRWEGGEHMIEKKVSIAPPSLLRFPEGYDTVIAEVSLGGSGKAELSIITNLAEDYGIAANTRKASDAKASILSDGKNIVPRSESDVLSRYGKPLIYYGGRVSFPEKAEIGKPLRISMDYCGEHELSLRGSYLHLQYTDAIEAALEACHEMRVPAEQVVKGLETFNGVPGRGELRRSGNGWEITDRNPGVSHMSVSKTLDALERMGIVEDALLILDPVNRKVCEKADAEQIRSMAERKGAGFCLASDDMPDGKSIIVRMIKEGYQ